MRAWYDANLGYQQVQQTRLPKLLPKVGAPCAPMTRSMHDMISAAVS